MESPCPLAFISNFSHTTQQLFLCVGSYTLTHTTAHTKGIVVGPSGVSGARAGSQVVQVGRIRGPHASGFASAAPALRRLGRAGREAPPRSAYADGSRRSERRFSLKISLVRRADEACDCCLTAENVRAALSALAAMLPSLRRLWSISVRFSLSLFTGSSTSPAGRRAF